MAIYTQRGLRSARMHKAEASDVITYLKNTINNVPTSNIKEWKTQTADYFISGEMKESENGEYIRNNDNVISRDCIVLDIDKDKEHTRKEVEENLENLHISAITYATPSNTESEERYRIVVPLAKAISDKSIYARNVQRLAELLPVNIDHASETWGQLMGVPCNTGDIRMFDGLLYPPLDDVLLDTLEKQKQKEEGFPPTTEKAPTSNTNTNSVTCNNNELSEETQEKSLSSSNCFQYSKEIALKGIKKYIKKEGERLKNRNNYVACFFSIVKAHQDSEISEETAKACIKALALNNKEWESGNLAQWEREKDTKAQTDKTFKERFLFGLDVEEQKNNDLDFLLMFSRNGAPSDIEQLLTYNAPPLISFVDNLLTQGLYMLVAPPKFGKSWLALDLALSLTYGRPFLGRQIQQANVLYMALEDSERRIQQRVHTLGYYPLPPNNGYNLHIISNAPPLTETSKKPEHSLIPFMDYWRTEKNKQVFIIDVFQKIRESKRGNINLYNAEYDELTPLHDWTKAHDVGVLLLHHSNKNKYSNDVADGISGSNALFGACDCGWILQKDSRQTKKATLLCQGRDVNSNMLLEFKSGRWEYLGDLDQVQDEQEQARIKYYSNPLIKTIRYLVATSKNKEVKISATDLQQKMIDLCGIESAHITATKRDIEKLQGELYSYDKISYSHSRTEKQRLHEFASCDRAMTWNEQVS